MAYFSHSVPHQRKILSGSYIKYRFMHDHQTWYGIFHYCTIYLYVIYQQISITVQYTINLKCMFKDILILHCVVFKIKHLTGVLYTLPVLLFKNLYTLYQVTEIKVKFDFDFCCSTTLALHSFTNYYRRIVFL